MDRKVDRGLNPGALVTARCRSQIRSCFIAVVRLLPASVQPALPPSLPKPSLALPFLRGRGPDSSYLG